MKVTRILATSFLAVGMAFFATNAHADGALTLSWNSCAWVQNLDFTGPGQVAKLVVAVNGETRLHKGTRVVVSIGTDLGDAWRFDAAGCNVGQATLSTALFSKACPAFQGGNPLPISNYSYDGLTGKATLDMLNAYDQKAPTGGDEALYQMSFDHLFSDSGPQNPALACGHADRPVCFHIVFSELLNPDLTTGSFNVANDWVTWNDAGNSTGCPGATQNENSTWGRVKGLYR